MSQSWNLLLAVDCFVFAPGLSKLIPSKERSFLYTIFVGGLGWYHLSRDLKNWKGIRHQKSGNESHSTQTQNVNFDRVYRFSGDCVFCKENKHLTKSFIFRMIRYSDTIRGIDQLQGFCQISFPFWASLNLYCNTPGYSWDNGSNSYVMINWFSSAYAQTCLLKLAIGEGNFIEEMTHPSSVLHMYLRQYEHASWRWTTMKSSFIPCNPSPNLFIKYSSMFVCGPHLFAFFPGRDPPAKPFLEFFFAALRSSSCKWLSWVSTSPGQ